MSTINHEVILERLTHERLASYLRATEGRVDRALQLYDWNHDVAAALHTDIGRLEIVFRNALDKALVAHGDRCGWPTPWHERAHSLFPGKHGHRSRDDVRKAQERATRSSVPPRHGKVIAELSFGFWRYLCVSAHLTSLWVPALAGAFPHHPRAGDASPDSSRLVLR